jgi:hypothetical protein
MVVILTARGKNSHNTIANKLIDDAAFLLDDPGHRRSADGQRGTDGFAYRHPR